MRNAISLWAILVAACVSSVATEVRAQGGKPLQASKIDEVKGTITKYTYAVPEKIGGDFQLITIERDGNTVAFEFITDAHIDPKDVKKFKLAKADVPVSTAEHDCRPAPGAEKVKTTFQGEAFERIIPPTTEVPPLSTPGDLVPALQIKTKSGKFRLFVGKFTLQQASSRDFYLNGEVHQIVTSFKSTLKQSSTGKTFTWTAKSSPEYEDPVTKIKIIPGKMPRFDIKRTYLAQFRVFKEDSTGKRHIAVVAIDTPGVLVPSQPKAFFGIQINPGDVMTYESEFSTYFWEDCEADGTLSLPTHRVDWQVHAELKHGDTMFFGSKGKSIKDDNTKLFPDPATGAGSLYHKAGINDPGTDKGWTPDPNGRLDKTE